MNILHIDSSILGPSSVSRLLSARIVEKIAQADQNAEKTYRDLGEHPVPHLSGAYLAAIQGASREHSPDMVADLGLGSDVLREFIAADIVVIGVPFYNFSISTQLKAWIDRIVIAGQTFRYDQQGYPQGLMGGKRVFLAISRGGYYNAAAPTAAQEHAETYLRAVFGFIGIDPKVIVAEGLAAGPEQRAAGIASAEQNIRDLAI